MFYSGRKTRQHCENHGYWSNAVGEFLTRITPDSLCIMPGDRSDLIVGTSLANISPKYPNISGIILTGGFTPEDLLSN